MKSEHFQTSHGCMVSHHNIHTKSHTLTSLFTVPNNQLTSLPHEIGTLSNLTYLYGESSQHSHTESHTLTSLFTVYHNQLKSLPHEIGNLSHLKILDTSRNKLTFLPCSLVRLPTLNLQSFSLLWFFILHLLQFMTIHFPLNFWHFQANTNFFATSATTLIQLSSHQKKSGSAECVMNLEFLFVEFFK